MYDNVYKICIKVIKSFYIITIYHFINLFSCPKINIEIQ